MIFPASLRTFLTLIAIMAIPIALSAFFFAGQSLRLDESQSLWQTSRSVSSIFTVVASDVHVPFYHLLLHFWRLYFGDTVAIARMLSLFFYLLSIPLLYLLGKLAYGRATGLFAAFLFAISPFMNWYGNEIRMYTLFTFFVILNQYFFVRLFRGEDVNDRIWIGYILTAIFGIFSHYFFFLSLAAQVVFYLMHRERFPAHALRRFILATVLVVLSFVPWAWYVLRMGQAGFSEPLLPVPSTVNLFSALSQFVFGFQNDNINTFFLSLWPITIFFSFLTLRRNGSRMRLETEYFLTTLIVSLAIAFFGSFLVTPIFVSRYLIFTVPSLYLLLASLFAQYSPRVGRVSRWSLAAVMLATLAIEIWSPTTPVKEDYAGASAYLTAHATAQDAIIISAPFTIYPIEYYYRGPAKLSTLPIWDQAAYGAIPAFSADALPDDVAKLTADSQDAYLLLSYDQGYEKIIKDYFDTHYQRITSVVFSPDLTVYEYQLRYDTALTVATSSPSS